MQRANGGSSIVVSEQEPYLCLTKADAKIRSAWSLLKQGPRDGQSFGKNELRKHLSAASLVRDKARFRHLRGIQNSLFPRESHSVVTGPSDPSEKDQDSGDFAQTASEEGFMPEDGFVQLKD